jgi:hypothetical protein
MTRHPLVVFPGCHGYCLDKIMGIIPAVSARKK